MAQKFSDFLSFISKKLVGIKGAQTSAEPQYCSGWIMLSGPCISFYKCDTFMPSDYKTSRRPKAFNVLWKGYYGNVCAVFLTYENK